MKNSNKNTDLNNMSVGAKIAVTIVLLLLSMAFMFGLIILVVAALKLVIDDIDPTVIVVIVPAVVAIFTYIYTKRNERKMFNIKDSREKKMAQYMEYIAFIENQRKSGKYNIADLLEQNLKIILIATNTTAQKINALVISISEHDKSKIETAIENVIFSIRADLGYVTMTKGVIAKMLFEKNVLPNEEHNEPRD